MSRKCNPFKKNRFEICYQLINAGIAGILVLVGAMSSGGITRGSLIFVLGSSSVVFLTKFLDYWTGQKGEYSYKVFNFITP